MKFLLFFGLGVLIMQSCAGTCGQDEPLSQSFSISGFVYGDTSKIPVSNCSVKYTGLIGTECVDWSGTDDGLSNNEGYYKLSKVYEEGDVSVVFSKEGYSDKIYYSVSDVPDTIKLTAY